MLPVSLGRDPAGNMDGNNGDGGREYVSPSGTEGSNRGSEDYGFLYGSKCTAVKAMECTCAARNSAVLQLA